MRIIIGCAVVVFALACISSAEAKGCLKGAVVGGAAGHYAGHHGVLGAAAGCIIGHHEAKKRERERMQEDRNSRELRPGEERL